MVVFCSVTTQAVAVYFRTGYSPVVTVTFYSVTTLVVVVLLRHGVYRGGSCYITPFVPSVLVFTAPAGTRTGHCIVSRYADEVRNVTTISASGSRAAMEQLQPVWFSFQKLAALTGCVT